MISQHKLRRFLKLQAAAKQFEEMLAEFKQMARDGNVTQQQGPLLLVVNTRPGKRRPPWKDKAVGLADMFKTQLGVESGNKWAEGVINDTVPSADEVSLSVVDRRAMGVRA